MATDLITTWNVLPDPPKWAPHRRGLTGVDNTGTLPLPGATFPANGGAKANRFRWALIRLRLTSGTLTSLKYRVVFWDPEYGANGGWVIDAGIAESAALALPFQASVEVLGRTFMIAWTVASVPSSPVVDIDVAGFGRVPDYA